MKRSGSKQEEVLIRCVFHINPDELDDEDFMKRAVEAKWYLEQNGWKFK